MDGLGTICSLLFVKLPWIRNVYEHESFVTQPKQAKTYELLFNRVWKKKRFKAKNSPLVGWLIGNIIGSSVDHDLNQDIRMHVPTKGYWYWFHEENGSHVLIAIVIFLE